MKTNGKKTSESKKATSHPFEQYEPALQLLFRFQSPCTPEVTLTQDTLIESLYDGAIKAASGFCHRLRLLPSDEWAAEAVHEWFCQLRPHRTKRYRPDLPFFPYAYAALWYVKVGISKRERRRTAAPLDLDEPDVRSDPQHLVELMEVDAFVLELPERLRKVINLRFFHGLSGNETAKIMKITPQGVRSRVHRGVSILRKKFADSGT